MSGTSSSDLGSHPSEAAVPSLERVAKRTPREQAQRLRALATANPPMYVTSEAAFASYDTLFSLPPAQRELYRKLLVEGPVRGRFVGMDRTDDAVETNPDRLLERFLRFGRAAAAKAAREALCQAKCSPEEISGIVVNTCTGYLCPGLSSYLSEDLGLRTSIRVMDLMGMGCGAAIPNLECSAGMLTRNHAGPVLSIAVEICSATLFMDDDPGLTVSNCIFGDGASAAIVDAPGADRAGLLTILDFESGLFPENREHLRYRSQDGRLRNVLGRRVPVIGARATAEVARRLLERHGLSTKEIRWWAVHTGGTSVLDQLRERLELDRDDLRFSYEVFGEYGNMSSPSVMFVLRKILDEGCPRAGELGLMLSFGAGFTAFAALVEF